MRADRMALRVEPGRYRLVDLEDVYFIEADGDDALLRTSRRERVRSTESLAQLEDRLAADGFLRIHRTYMVNLARIREVRLRGEGSQDWEVKLEPPVNRVLPVARELWPSVRQRLGL